MNKKLFSIILIVLILFLAAGISIEVMHQKEIHPIDSKKMTLLTEKASHLLNQSNKKDNLIDINFEKAQIYFRNAQFDKAYQALLPFAKDGQITAALEVGYLYEFGLGVKQSYQTAALWYYLTISLDDYNRNSVSKGIDYYFGLNGRDKNYQKAALWFRMAAELSNDRQ